MHCVNPLESLWQPSFEKIRDTLATLFEPILVKSGHPMTVERKDVGRVTPTGVQRVSSASDWKSDGFIIR